MGISHRWPSPARSSGDDPPPLPHPRPTGAASIRSMALVESVFSTSSTARSVRLPGSGSARRSTPCCLRSDPETRPIDRVSGGPSAARSDRWGRLDGRVFVSEIVPTGGGDARGGLPPGFGGRAGPDRGGEPVGQGDQAHVVVPPVPGAGLVVAEPEVPFGLLKEPRGRVGPAEGRRELIGGRLGSGVGEVISQRFAVLIRLEFRTSSDG
jgi:hypothetical protein